MTCNICGSLKRLSPIKEFHWPGEQDHDTFRRSDVSFTSLFESARSCPICDVLLVGLSGCIRQHGLKIEDADKVDIEFQYYFYEHQIGESECRNLITLHLLDSASANLKCEKFVAEFFTLAGSRW
jgi:hypothetical protein